MSSLVALDPTRGSEIRKTRPCVVVSPDELNRHLRTLIVAPMTTGGQGYPWRVPCRFQQKDGFMTLDQLRTIDRERVEVSSGALLLQRWRRRSRCCKSSLRSSVDHAIASLEVRVHLLRSVLDVPGRVAENHKGTIPCSQLTVVLMTSSLTAPRVYARQLASSVGCVVMPSTRITA